MKLEACSVLSIHVKTDALIDDYSMTELPPSVFMFMNDGSKTVSDLQREFDSITDLR